MHPRVLAPGHVSSVLLVLALVVAGCESKPPKPKDEKETEERSASGDTSLEQHREAARMYFDRGEFDRAADQYRRILEQKTDDPEATLGLGMSYAQLGDRDPVRYSQSRELLQRYADEMARPGDTRGLLSLGILSIKEASAAGGRQTTLESQRAKYDTSLADLRERQEASDSAAERRRLEAEITTWRRRLDENAKLHETAESERAKKLDEAVRHLTRVIETNKLEVLAYKLRAEAQALRGKEHYGEAIEDIDVYVELAITTARDELTRLLEQGEDDNGDPIDRAGIVNAIERLDRAEANMYEMRASLQRRLGLQPEAIADLEHVLALAPDRASAYAEIARASEEMGNYVDAIDYYKQYIEALPVGAVDAKTQAKLRIDELEGIVARRGLER